MDTMIQAEGCGAFVRALMPAPLTGGYTVTYGLWLERSPRGHAPSTGRVARPTYPELVLDGVLANAVEP